MNRTTFVLRGAVLGVGCAIAAFPSMALSAPITLDSSSLDELTPAARAEVMRLVAKKPAIAQQTSATNASAPAGTVASVEQENNFLCLETFGCIGGSLSGSLESFRNASDSFQAGHGGAVAGFDIAAPVPYLAAYGIGAQAGGSFGIYDWGGGTNSDRGAAGSGSAPGNHQRQNFFTVGLFRQPGFNGPWWQRFGVGFVYDYNTNTKYGALEDTFNLRQWRGKLAYDLTENHEIGALGTWHAGEATGRVGAAYRSASQISVYYQYTFDDNAKLAFAWAPGSTSSISSTHYSGFNLVDHDGYHDVLNLSGQVPLNNYIALFANGTYAFENTNANPGTYINGNDAFQLLAGVKFYWGGDAATPAWQRKHWEPFLPDANNGNFLVDGSVGSGS